jgi:hypothetical protein
VAFVTNIIGDTGHKSFGIMGDIIVSKGYFGLFFHPASLKVLLYESLFF